MYQICLNSEQEATKCMRLVVEEGEGIRAGIT